MYALCEEFVIGSTLGRGSSATVYGAKSLTRGCDVALKVLHATPTKTAQRCLAREAQLATSVCSKRVPKVLHTMGRDATSFIAMERLAGRTLEQHIAEHGPLGLSEVTRVLSGACAAIRDVHAAGFAHRDIKPANIFLLDDGDIKIIDFGSACELGALDTWTGTPMYMSPERMAGGARVNTTSDVWSIGVVAFECLTAQRPFSGNTLAQLAAQVMYGRIPAVSELAPHLRGSDVDLWCHQALQRDCAMRFRCVDELTRRFGLSALA